jgi:hypothetical protein
MPYKNRELQTMTKTTEKTGKPERVPPITTIDVPVSLMLAALSCASDEETRYYLNGVYLHSVKNDVRVVATDGHRLLVSTYKPESGLPDWLEDGVIIPSEMLKQRLGLIKAAGGKPMPGTELMARLGYAKGAPKLLMADTRDDNVFRITPIDGDFPPYDRLIEGATGAFDASSRKDFEPVGFNSKYLKAVGDIGRMLDAKTVAVYASRASEAAIITFQERPGVLLMLMPTRLDAVIQKETALLMSPAIKGSLAALKAHVTRNAEAAEELPEGSTERADFETKAQSFRDRITAIMVATGQRKALPPPAPEPVEPEATVELGPRTEGPLPGEQPESGVDHERELAAERGAGVDEVVGAVARIEASGTPFPDAHAAANGLQTSRKAENTERRARKRKAKKLRTSTKIAALKGRAARANGAHPPTAA